MSAVSNAASIQSMTSLHAPTAPGLTAAGKEEGRASQTPAAKPTQPYTNPALRLDPALGLVVIEFHDDAGELTRSIPNQRQIEAYRMHDKTLPGMTFPGTASPGTPSPGPVASGPKDGPPSAG